MRTARGARMAENERLLEVETQRLSTQEDLEKEKKEKIQKALEDALVAADLQALTVSTSSNNGGGRELERRVNDPEVRQHENDEGRELSSFVTVKGDDSIADHTHSEVPKTEWMDITERFRQAAWCLAPGELVQEANFSLFDAMSAIELMDSKMDASLQWSTFREFPQTSQEAVEKGILRFSGHEPRELVGIFDEVFACVATWLEGHTLAQTVFTCMYLLDTTATEDICLRGFSQAIVKTVDYMRGCICQGRVFTEDDQQGVCFGFNMLNCVSDTSVAAVLKEAEEEAQTLLRQATTSINRTNAEVTNTSSVSDVQVLKALLIRIKLTRNLFTFVTCMAKNTAQGLQGSLQKLSQCVKLIDDVISTIDLGPKLDPTNPLKLGFHPVINQHLLPPSYKPYSILPRQKGLQILQTIFSQIQKILAVGKLTSFRELFEAVLGFCAVRECPNVLVRSLLVLVCLQGDRTKLFGSPSFETLLHEDIRLFCSPPCLNPRSPVSSSSQGKEIVQRFFGRAVSPMIEFLRIYCQHRARQRYKIVRSLDMFSELQQETERMDHHLTELTAKLDPQRQHMASFGSWLLYYVLHLMAEYILLGFEYNLYSPFELHYIYWYLEYIYGWHHTTLKSAEKMLMAEPAATGKAKRKVKKKRELPKEKEREAAIIHAKRLTCVGLMRGLEALILDHKIPQPKFEYGSEELCFQHRFLPFAALATPQFLPHSEYIKLAGVQNYEGRDVNLYEASARHFITARTAVESIPHLDDDLDNLLKTIKTNTVVMNLAARGHKRDSKLPPTLDYSVHRHFPVIRIN